MATLASATTAEPVAAIFRGSARGSASPWSTCLHSGFSRASAYAGTGFTGKRGAKRRSGSGASPRAAAHHAAIRGPQ